jgi:diguanylate cyclase (GGDEF)-like protein
MDRSWAEAVQDPAEVRFRVDCVLAGVVLTVVLGVAGMVYAAIFAERQALVGAFFAAGLLGAGVVWALPWARIIRSPWREPVFLAWSFADIALIATAVVVDGGARSPLALVLFVPAVYAATSYPLVSVIAVGAISVVTYICIGVASVGAGDAHGYVLMFSLSLTLTAMMSAWQARNHDRRRHELAEMSRTDPLTGCLNRRGFTERGDAYLADAKRTGRPLALVTLDLDRFKQVNDTRGHNAGDEILCWTAERLGTVVRPIDGIGRLGGDEFVVILHGSDEGDAVNSAERMRSALGSRAPASFGVSSHPRDGDTLDELLSSADARLYADKEAGRAAPPPDRERLGWAAALAHAADLRMGVQNDHAGAVAELAVGIACELGWSDERRTLLRLAATLHDVGKVAVSEQILVKPGPLTIEEYDEVKKHSVVGSQIVARVEGLGEIVPWIRHAHEHLDGSGYPDGLSGDAIPEASRIILVADAYDAITSDRAYRSACSSAEALAELQDHAGTQFDPRCVGALRTTLATAAGRAPTLVPASL